MSRHPKDEIVEPMYRPEIARRLRGKIRVAASNSNTEVRVWLTNKLEKILAKESL